MEIAEPRSLLVHVGLDETDAGQDMYMVLVVQALRLSESESQAHINLLPLLELTSLEQQIIRAWLIGRRWPAWARATQSVRGLLGVSDMPVLLANAARQLWMPLTTLQSAAADDRLPTIRIAGRHLVYLDTILEAQQRGLLHAERGRPQRRKR